jgi:bifunctional DNA-binding transcriptional regulator/antitoxin component of YhaV-PrlF toxin-antitoxin module
MQSQSFHLKIGDGRRIVLPTDVCDSLQLGIGDTVIVAVEDDHVTLRSVDSAVQRFQALVAEKVPAGTSLVDELIGERQDNARRE